MNGKLIEIQLLADKVISLSQVLKSYEMDWKCQRIRIKFFNDNKFPVRYMSGRYETMKERLHLMVYGLEEVHMRRTYQQ